MVNLSGIIKFRNIKMIILLMNLMNSNGYESNNTYNLYNHRNITDIEFKHNS